MINSTRCPSLTVFLSHFWAWVICFCRSPADKANIPSQPLSLVNQQSVGRPHAAVPRRLISSSLCYLWCWADLRSARWWWIGGVSEQCPCVASMLCQPLPVPASAAAAPPRFSARKQHWAVCPFQIWVLSKLLFIRLIHAHVRMSSSFTKTTLLMRWE